MKIASIIKNRVLTRGYISPMQLRIDGFETVFEQKLLRNSRWVKLTRSIP